MYSRRWKGTYHHKSEAIYEDISISKIKWKGSKNDKEVALMEMNVMGAILLVLSS